MPVVETHIRMVQSEWRRTRYGQRQKFLVFPVRPHEPGAPMVYETWNAWHASLAKRAGETGQAIRLGLKDVPRWGLEIVTAELVQEARVG